MSLKKQLLFGFALMALLFFVLTAGAVWRLGDANEQLARLHRDDLAFRHAAARASALLSEAEGYRLKAWSFEGKAQRAHLDDMARRLKKLEQQLSALSEGGKVEE